MENTGLILESFVPHTGFFGGPGDDMPVVLPSGDWEPHLPVFETQQKFGLETLSCVSFSCLNVIETTAKFLGKNFDLSDRALAWASGTTHNGNTFSNVQIAIQRFGTCDELIWPFNVPMNWDTFYSTPPVIVQEAMKGLLKDWKIGSRVFVPLTLDSFKAALKKGPLWVCDDVHAFILYRIDDKIHEFDTYGQNGDGRKVRPLSFLNTLRAAFLLPVSLKPLTPPPMVNLPANSLVVVVDGHGERLMNIDGTKLYQDDPGLILTVVMERNAKYDAQGLLMCGQFPRVNVTTAEIASIPRFNLKNQPL